MSPVRIMFWQMRCRMLLGGEWLPFSFLDHHSPSGGGGVTRVS